MEVLGAWDALRPQTVLDLFLLWHPFRIFHLSVDFFYNIPINANKVISHIPFLIILQNDQTQQTNNLELWFTFEIGGCSLKLNSKYVRCDLNPVGIVWNWMIFRISVPIFWRTGFWEETLTRCLKISKFNFVNFDLFIIFFQLKMLLPNSVF